MNKVYIIAEAGVNHNGNIDTALQLIDVACASGADCVKFQSFIAKNLVSRKAEKAEYQIENTGDAGSQLEMLKQLELGYDDCVTLQKHCNNKGIDFLSTPFDLDSIETLDKINIRTWKIPSGEITNLPYLRKIGSYNYSVIMSTGMSTLDEVKEAVDVLVQAGTNKENITILHCNTEYPTPYEDVNLNAMLTMQSALGTKVGYSDHTPGIEVPIAAVALGAVVIEKHFTLDKTMPGPDHKASLEPDELTSMVLAIRNIEKALGDGQKVPSRSERKNINIARKSIIASKLIKKGEVLTEDNITTKRPGNGINPMQWDNIIGKEACRDFEPDELIEL